MRDRPLCIKGRGSLILPVALSAYAAAKSGNGLLIGWDSYTVKTGRIRRNEEAAFFVRWRILHAPCWNSSGGEWCPTVLYSLLLLLLYSYVSKSIQKWKPISFHFSFRSMLDRSRCDKNPIWSDDGRSDGGLGRGGKAGRVEPGLRRKQAN